MSGSDKTHTGGGGVGAGPGSTRSSMQAGARSSGVGTRSPGAGGARSSGGNLSSVSPAAEKTGGWMLWTIVGAVVLGGVITMTGSSRMHRPDPHFLTAQRTLRDYELGKDPATLNYDDPVYPSVMSELALVNPASISASEAQELSGNLADRTARFHERLRVRAKREEEARSADDNRKARLLDSQIASTGIDTGAARRLTLSAATECLDEGNGSSHSHDKSH